MESFGTTANRKTKTRRASHFFKSSTFAAAVYLALTPATAGAGGTTNTLTGDPLDRIQNTDTLNFIVGGQVRYDSNLFRLPGSEDPFPGESQQSDFVYTTNAGIRIDKSYSQQRFLIEAQAVDNRFQKYDFLDFTAFNYSALWNWHLTPRITGILLAEQKEELNSFAEFLESRERNISTTNVRLFTIDGDIGRGFHLIGGLMDIRARNSVTFEAVGDYQQDGVEFGGKYVAPSNNWISIVQREMNGEFRGRELDPIRQLDTGFDHSETEANMFWRLSGKSVIEGRLGYIKREHDNFDERDFSGMTSRIQYSWAPTGKTELKVALSRNIYSYQEEEHSYYVADTFSISPIWKYSPKTTFRARYDYSERDYRGAIIPVPELREDKMHLFLIAADWKATDNIIVTGILQRDTRNSNQEDLDFHANSATINAQFLF